jgi:PAS domain S-box-containing protein
MAVGDSPSGPRFSGTVTRYGLAICVTVLALYLRSLLIPFLGLKNPYHPLWAAIAFSAWYCGLGASVLSTLIGLIGVWYWFLPGDGLFAVPASDDAYGMIGFLLVAGLIVAIGESNRRSHLRLVAAESEAHRVQALFETFMDNSPAVIYLKDEEGRFIYMNRTVRERFHLASAPGKTDLGKTDFDLFPPELAAQYREHDALVLRENRSREFIERSLEADGEHIWLALKFPVVDSKGRRLLGVKSFDITDRHRAEQALEEARQQLELRVEERTSELSEANQSLRELSFRLLQLQDEERRRIARELHDSVGQLLAAIAMNMQFVKEQTAEVRAVNKAVRENEAMLEQVMREIRTISHLLHPPLLDEVGLPSALSWFVQEFGERSKMSVQVEVDPSLGRMDREVETAIFRIVQECLTNIHRHSGGSTAVIRLSDEGDKLQLEVQDDGRGIPPEKQIALNSSGRAGVGLRGMRERVGQFGGTLDIRSNHSGTTVMVTLPLIRPSDAAEQVA